MSSEQDDDDLDLIVRGYSKPKSVQQAKKQEREVIVLSGSETESATEYETACTDDDDLDAPVRGKVKTDQFKTRYPKQSKGQCGEAQPKAIPHVQTDGGSTDDEPEVRKRPHGHGGGKKIIMTDDEEEDGYEKWRHERAAETKKRPVAKGGEDERLGAGVKKQRLDVEKSGMPMVGQRKAGRAERQQKVVGVRSAAKVTKRYYDGDEDEMDDTLSQVPERVQKRKEIIDLAHKTLDEMAALKLPPTYEDVDFSDDEQLEELAERPSFPNLTPPGKYEDIHLNTSLGVIPAPIAQWLREYQVKGTQFLHEKFVYQRGGILGDDMGLGKTVQVIAFLTAAFGKTGDERDKKRIRKMRRLGDPDEVWYPRVLIVCPGTLMENWKNELDTWGWWTYDIYHGSKDEKEGALRAAQNGLCEIMITTYTTYKNNKDLINQIPWDCVIADECHIIKERKSDITKAMNEINALCRIGLTGTALQNKYEELWTLLNWCNPGSVGPANVWNKTISRPLKLGQAHDATNRQLGNARRIAYQLVTNLLPRMFLRRMKSLIADQLPEKSDRVVFCPLTKTQAEAYENFCESDVVTLVKYSTAKCDCGSEKKRGFCCYQETEDGRHWRELVFPCIQNVLKLCNHIANWIPLNEEPPDKRAEKLEWLQTCLPDDWERIMKRSPLENYMDPELCGKWIILQKLLNFWHTNGDKVLIFSYSIKLLDILRCLFTNTSYNVEYLDGKMSLEDRVRAVSTFNTSPLSFIFLISTRAGGMGLNITSANKVVIFDPSWNPSHDLQAQDRAYRIGQRRDVEVFRLVSAGTIEEVVYARQIYKQQQANIGYGASTERRYFTGVMGEEGRKGELFGLVNMFTFHGNDDGGGVGGMLVKDVVNKTNVAEGRMGVRVIGFDASKLEEGDEDLSIPAGSGDEDDDPVSQLEALATGKGGKKKLNGGAGGTRSNKLNPIQAILSAAGVHYTHENSEVIGSSAIEAQISRRALEGTHDQHLGEIPAFGTSRRESATPAAPGSTIEVAGQDDEEDTVVLDGVKYRFRPPEDVKRRQFCSMAKMFGFESVQEFALVVEGWTPAQRRKALERFYRLLRDRREARERGEGDGEGDAKDRKEVKAVEVEKEEKKRKEKKESKEAATIDEKGAKDDDADATDPGEGVDYEDEGDDDDLEL
ncbi:P-loop containing nucleoside triphosphate hydrolase protein [Kalaharituber pfeilii]|nr:P-loop containing nucleoside triphosphate hydrolase protein [Kalaharituber pfeilii]